MHKDAKVCFLPIFLFKRRLKCVTLHHYHCLWEMVGNMMKNFSPSQDREAGG